MMHPWLPKVVELVRQAGKATLPFWRSQLAVQQKADDSPVTAADLAAHQILNHGLQLLAPEVPVLSEEACELPLQQRARWTRWWLVDPLDGTKDFIAGAKEFTVNVALIEAGRVCFGVVGIPVTGRCYFGGADMGAWREESAGQAQPIQVAACQAQRLTLVASKRHGSLAQERLLTALAGQFADLQLANISSSLKFCLVAEGAADCYPRLSPTSQWDTAAAQGLLEGAGGVVLDLQGEPLSYPAREDFLNPTFMALPRHAKWRDSVLQLTREALGESGRA